MQNYKLTEKEKQRLMDDIALMREYIRLGLCHIDKKQLREDVALMRDYVQLRLSIGFDGE